MQQIDFIQSLHSKTRRNYVQRVVDHDKAECAAVAKQWGFEYWDGERRFGYGGMRYDGRWAPVAERMAAHYGLKPGDRILDVGCGKAYLLYEFTQVVPGVEVVGIDISAYGVENAKPEMRPYLQVGEAQSLPFETDSFDFVLSLGTLHNLGLADLFSAVREIERVGAGDAKYVMVESFRNEEEKANLLYWQLTCESFHRPDDWRWMLEHCGYKGDYGFIYFE